MRAISLVLGTIVLLLCGGSAHAQGCATILTPHFSLYTNVTRDGKNIYTSVTMQGYASIGSSAGCLMSTSVHHVGAENVLNGVAHWTYSATGCPSCYFTATNNEQMVGNPGTNYPFAFEGDSICSQVGQFFTTQPPAVTLPGCVAPATETTAVEATIFVTSTAFNQSIADSAGDTFNGQTVTEGNAAPGQDTCWGTWSSGPRYTGVPTNPASYWPVGGGQVTGQPNHWGFDRVGWTQQAVDYYRVQAPAHGVAIPCGATGYQSMTITCFPGAPATYTPTVGNKLTGTIEQHDVINCRYDISNSACQTILY
jgi:hypothetical protein